MYFFFYSDLIIIYLDFFNGYDVIFVVFSCLELATSPPGAQK